MLCLVRHLFVISTGVIDCLGRFVPEMTYYVSSGTLNLALLARKVLEFQIYSRLSNLNVTVHNYNVSLLVLLLFSGVV